MNIDRNMDIPLTLIQQKAFEGLPAIFRECAAHGDMYKGYDMRLPWREGDYAYAATRVIMVRVPLDTLSLLTRERLRNAKDVPPGLPEMFQSAGPWALKPIRRYAIQERLTCEVCDGKGGLMVFGRTILCSACDGDGWIFNHAPVMVHPKLALCSCQVGMLQRHNALIYLSARDDPSDVPSLFRVGPATGLVMPMAEVKGTMTKDKATGGVSVEMVAPEDVPPEVLDAVKRLAARLLTGHAPDDDDDDDDDDDESPDIEFH